MPFLEEQPDGADGAATPPREMERLEMERDSHDAGLVARDLLGVGAAAADAKGDSVQQARYMRDVRYTRCMHCVRYTRCIRCMRYTRCIRHTCHMRCTRITRITHIMRDTRDTRETRHARCRSR